MKFCENSSTVMIYNLLEEDYNYNNAFGVFRDFESNCWRHHLWKQSSTEEATSSGI